MADILAQNGDHLFMIDAGKQDDLQLVRVYDLLMNTYGDPILQGTLVAHMPGWGPVTAIQPVLDHVEEQAATQRY